MKVKLFTTKTCATCETVKRFLQHKNMNYEVVDITDSPEKQQWIFNLTGRMIVPVAVFEKEGQIQRYVVGPNFKEYLYE